ncbi:MAG TPA: flagellar hook-length control protein FliK [Pyrinomonadaceae bacterium]|jgi:hypothetical protein
MNVNSVKNRGPKDSQVSGAEATNEASRARREPDDRATPAGAKRDFASVLKEVSRPHLAEGADEGGGPSGTGEAPATENRPERENEREESRDEARHDAAPGARTGVAEADSRVEVTSASAILHRADLEKIVEAVYAQTADGRHVLTLELTRSVLDGLRVRLVKDASGRLTAEFLAPGEKLRAVLESRSQELAELLRSRGVNLDSVKVSVGAESSDPRRGSDSSGGGDEGGGSAYQQTASRKAGISATDSASGSMPEETADADGDLGGDAAPTTRYRA